MNEWTHDENAIQNPSKDDHLTHPEGFLSLPHRGKLPFRGKLPAALVTLIIQIGHWLRSRVTGSCECEVIGFKSLVV